MTDHSFKSHNGSEITAYPAAGVVHRSRTPEEAFYYPADTDDMVAWANSRPGRDATKRQVLVNGPDGARWENCDE